MGSPTSPWGCFGSFNSVHAMWHKVGLVQDAGHASNCTLGDYLKSKSQERDGIMQTHDEETHRYFESSSMLVLLCPRTAGKEAKLDQAECKTEIGSWTMKRLFVILEALNLQRS
ncbi:phospholipase D [Sarracenia purpurea var. burkii]